MKIVKLIAENVKRLRAVEIEPDGALVEITGKNGAGKTSVLDAIFWALAGTRNHQEKPVRAGADEARIELDLGDVVVRRRFRSIAGEGETPDRVTTSLQVESADGARYPSPQKMLDALLGTLSFDPLAFSRATRREQYKTLSGFVADIDFEAEARRRRTIYEERTVVNRTARERKAAASAIEVPDGPDAPLSIMDLTEELKAANAHNSGIASERLRRQHEQDLADRDHNKADRVAARIDELQAELDRLESELKRARASASERSAEIEKLPPLGDRVDVDDITRRIADAEDHNAAYAEKQMYRQRRDSYTADAEVAEDESRKLTAKLEAQDAALRSAIAEADMPVDGLSLEDGKVLLDEIPLEQASDAEQLRLSCAIAMRQNAKLRVLRVRDGSLLDEDSLELLRVMAEERDYQVWIERVDSSGTVGFVIEDGSHAVAEKDAS